MDNSYQCPICGIYILMKYAKRLDDGQWICRKCKRDEETNKEIKIPAEEVYQGYEPAKENGLEYDKEKG